MSHKENNFPVENKHDRKKQSKYEVGDLIQIKFKTFNKGISTNVVIFDKHQSRDKHGLYWVYDILYPDNNQVIYSTRLIDSKEWSYTKLA